MQQAERRRRWSIRQQLIGLFTTVVVLGALMLVADEWNRRSSMAALEELRSQSLGTLRQAKAVSDAYGLDVVDTTFRIRNGLIDWTEGAAVVARTRERLRADWRALYRLARSPDQADLMEEMGPLRLRADAAASELAALIEARDITALGRFADQRLYPSIDPVTERLQALVQMEQGRAVARVEAESARQDRQGWYRLGIVAGVIGLFVLVGRRLLRGIYRGVEDLVGFARNIQRQEFASSPRRPGGELGEVMDAMLAMRDDLAAVQDALADSEARAQDANRAKSSFVATMSHEIRTPLIGVTGMLEVLGHSRLDADQRRSVEVAQESAEALLRIVGDVLDFSKIEADRLVIEARPTDLRALLRSTVSNFEGAASARNLLLDLDLDPRLADAYVVDALRLRQVVSNLVNNALKFTEHGGVMVRALREGEDGARHRLRLQVLDTGVGIDAAEQARLFEPFQQAGGSGPRRPGGTGLGLTISRRLVQLMGGDVSLHSEPGEGTRVDLALALEPCARGAVDAVSPAPWDGRDRAAPTRDVALAQGRLVLLVDDHPTNRAVIARQLGLAGYACDTAVDGGTAFEQWQALPYGLVLTDLHMPGVDGYGLARAIRAAESAGGRRRSPIVALTAAVTAEDVARCEAAGIDLHLAKPSTVPQIAQALDRFLGPPPPMATAPASGAAPDGTLPGPAASLPPALAPREPVLDAGVLDGLAAGDAALAGELLAEFLSACVQDLAALDVALPADRDAAQREAHRIKGAARLVGAVQLAARAEALEAALRRGEAGDAAPVHEAYRALRALSPRASGTSS